jgi:hypothetical protein
MIHVGVNLHQRFCYMTALEARGKVNGLKRTETDSTPGVIAGSPTRVDANS